MRAPPSNFGMSTRRMGEGMYFPSRIYARMLAPWRLRCASLLSTVMPSTSGVPLLAFTRLHASSMLRTKALSPVKSLNLPFSSSTRPPSACSATRPHSRALYSADLDLVLQIAPTTTSADFFIAPLSSLNIGTMRISPGITHAFPVLPVESTRIPSVSV